MKTLTSMRDALDDDNLLGRALPGDTWRPWKVLLIALLGEQLTEDERALFKRMTGREHEPGQRVREFAAAIGRRGGKTRALATLGSYLGALCSYRDVLARGETGILLCVAQDQSVATKIIDYVHEDLSSSDILKQRIIKRNADGLELVGNIKLEVKPATFRRLRGATYVGVICDEVAFWYTDSTYANPDSEVLAAIRPGLITTGGPLIMASSPYARRGVLWDVFRRHYGPDGSPAILVAHGTSKDFNPTLPQEFIDQALEEDYARNSAEYLAQFRTDIEGFISLEVVEACIGGYHELMPHSDTEYFAFVDPSGGSEDSMTLAIAHRDDDERVIINAVREARPSFSPAAVVEDFAALLKMYHITSVTGDAYGGEFVKEPFRKLGIDYELAEHPKSDLYRDLLPLLNSGGITLPKHDRLIGQIVGLERKVSRAGKDSIDHAPRAHDDLANAVAGVAAATRVPGYSLASLLSGYEETEKPKLPGWQRAGFASAEAAEQYKTRLREMHGRVSFPWDGHSW